MTNTQQRFSDRSSIKLANGFRGLRAQRKFEPTLDPRPGKTNIIQGSDLPKEPLTRGNDTNKKKVQSGTNQSFKAIWNHLHFENHCLVLVDEC